jgi:NAD(P)-dependent dehydrogenase (short-subunit alcohol dehydrogenase family)
MQRFIDKVVLVTGATSGIGRQAAIEFAKEGAKVVLAGRRKSEGDAVVEDIIALGADAIFVETDVTVPAAVERLVNTTIEKYGQLDCAFNNAGIGGPNKPLTEVSEDEWDRVMNVNLKGVWLCLKYQIPQMLQNGGSIVNMSSMWALGASSLGVAPYISSKHGVIGLTKSAALEFANKGVRVNAICPAWIHTPANDHVLSDPQIKAQIIAGHPVERLGTAQEIAEAVMWLCSDKTGFITGHSLLADGGMAARL